MTQTDIVAIACVLPAAALIAWLNHRSRMRIWRKWMESEKRIQREIIIAIRNADS